MIGARSGAAVALLSLAFALVPGAAHAQGAHSAGARRLVDDTGGGQLTGRIATLQEQVVGGDVRRRRGGGLA